MWYQNEFCRLYYLKKEEVLYMFDFNLFPFALSGKTVAYICPKCKYKFDAPIEAVLEFEQEDEWNGLPISTPPYTICATLINVFQLIMYQGEVFTIFIRIINIY